MRGAADEPCTALLKDNQLRALGFAPGTGAPRALPYGFSACVWERDGGDVSFDLSAFPTRDLLVDSYRTKIFRIFIPATIADVPAVLQKSDPGSTICTATAGVADGQAVESTWYGSTRKDSDPCAGARSVIEAVVGNLPPLR